MLEWLLHILISFMVLGIALFPIQTVKFKSSKLYGLAGVLVLCKCKWKIPFWSYREVQEGLSMFFEN